MYAQAEDDFNRVETNYINGMGGRNNLCAQHMRNDRYAHRHECELCRLLLGNAQFN